MTSWERAQTALALLAVDPTGLGGITVKARVGPARDAFLSEAKKMSPDQVKLHPTMTSDALDGSIDITATLERGKIIHHDGLLARTDRSFILSMAERADPYLAARLAMSLDAGELRGLIALDEGVDDDEHLPANLADRLAFQVSLDDLSMADISVTKPGRQSGNPNTIEIPGDLPEQLVILAVRLGIHSLRAPSFALRAAKAHAVLLGRNRVCSEDITAAVELVFAHRATQLPQQDDPTPPEPEQPDSPPPDQGQQDNISIPDEMLLEAVLSALPDGLLDRLNTTKSKSGKGAGSGKKIIGNRRGRPLPPRDGIARSDARVDLMATLRAAIPWQTIRKASQPDRVGPIIRPSDLRSKRYQELSDRVLVFAVDASGSAALARLGEAKGAIELLLGEAYSRRDHVALIAFRGTEADILLPPTRSLVQTKRRLASLPGGGGTPLASGLLAAMTLSESARKRGQTPTIVILTDGRSNIALDGTPNRKIAAEDAVAMGHQIRASGFDTIVIDTGNRPEQSLKSLADAMAGHYITLPRADAKHLSETISTTLKA
jgi:magnesium chelatase subunit D